MTTSASTRQYDVGDAILLWLNFKLSSGSRLPRYNLAEVMEISNWEGDPITQQDWELATRYLKRRGYIDGSEGWGAGVARPTLTNEGEDLVASGQSCRPRTDREKATGVTNHINITNTGHALIAIDSNDFTQTLQVGSTDDKLEVLAELLRRYAQTAPNNVAQVEEYATRVQEAADTPADQRGPLAALLGQIVSAVSAAAGTAIGQQVIDLSVNLMQALPA